MGFLYPIAVTLKPSPSRTHPWASAPLKSLACSILHGFDDAISKYTLHNPPFTMKAFMASKVKVSGVFFAQWWKMRVTQYAHDNGLKNRDFFLMLYYFIYEWGIVYFFYIIIVIWIHFLKLFKKMPHLMMILWWVLFVQVLHYKFNLFTNRNQLFTNQIQSLEGNFRKTPNTTYLLWCSIHY